jgi:cell wall-associated NlpC family hydrolase
MFRNSANAMLSLNFEARSWCGVPYVEQGDIKSRKGGGIDCGMSLVRVFCDTGLVEPFDPRPYSNSWFLHQNEEKYLQIIERCGGREIEGPPLPGDIVVWKVGRLYAHGGIVTEWPRAVHAFKKARMCLEEDVTKQGFFTAERHPRKFYSYWAGRSA